MTIDALKFRMALLAVASAFAVLVSPAQAQTAFGDDSSEWALDGECDDPRFVGDGMAEVLLGEDRFGDATDCRTLFEAGYIRLRGGDESVPGAVDFGTDTSDWIFDGECDDPRFIGDGMAEVLLEEDRLADATDCRALYESGNIRMRTEDERLLTDVGGIPAVELRAGVAGQGKLERGDRTLDDGEYCDFFTFEGTAGALAVVMLRTNDFDPYLIVRGPDGEQIENDDYEGNANRSVVTFPMQQSGTYTIGVTSYAAKEIGSYSVLFEIQSDTATPVHHEPFGELGVRDSTRDAFAGNGLLASSQ